MNKIILSSIIFSFMFLSNIFALRIKNDTDKKIKVQLDSRSIQVFKKITTVNNYTFNINPRSYTTIVGANIIYINTMKVTDLTAAPLAENKTKVWNDVLRVNEIINNKEKVIKIYIKNGKFARKVYKSK